MSDLTADQAKAAVFTETRRGFDVAEVRAFQAEAAAALRHLEATVARLETDLEQYRESEEAVRRTYVAAVREKDEMITEARAGAEVEAAAAKQEAGEVVAASHDEAAAILSEALR
ncbi:MAG: DivIVA domain-containing protein, partial [Acidimicrobiia bacterium]|nr:DivIVA domain-containing protein [Acidimicrobiia bacterium]